ncbi:P-type ATPase [Planoprotostelium fungivorum]|uniref:P-type ATPase n=1 Tax=Planoprotostelium fungivorum TaxID=1890364 RepID=A0A2P6ND45_9EUKA|nr:P-type ATPase [Planoprotostelium fungivorum]
MRPGSIRSTEGNVVGCLFKAETQNITSGVIHHPAFHIKSYPAVKDNRRVAETIHLFLFSQRVSLLSCGHLQMELRTFWLSGRSVSNYYELAQEYSLCSRSGEKPTRSWQENSAEIELLFGFSVVDPVERIISEGRSPEMAPKEYQAEEHQWTLEQLAEHHGAKLDYETVKKSAGLNTSEAEKRLAIDGKNRLTPPKRTPEWIKFLREFINPFMILLQVAALLCIVAYALETSIKVNLYLAIILFVIVIGTCVMGYWQERKSGGLMDSFKNMLPPKCMVVRDGQEQKVLSEDLVIGDIVIITSGDKIPADVRLIACQDLKVDNSSLTGESEPQSRNAEVSKEENPLESANFAFYGTLAVDGSAWGVVIRTGDNTLLGQIAGLAGAEAKETTLEKEVKRFVYFIAALAIISGIIFFVVGLFVIGREQRMIINNLINTIGIIVANVPEGLPATVTICLTIAARRLAQRQVWVKELESVETLGSTSMICSDKTGTLTQNRMTAVHAWYDDVIHNVKSPLGTDKQLDSPLNIQDPSASRLLRIASVCCRAQFEAIPMGTTENPSLMERAIIGDASETALLRMCESYFDSAEFRGRFPKLFEIPFNSSNKYQLSIHSVTNETAEFKAKNQDTVVDRRMRPTVYGLGNANTRPAANTLRPSASAYDLEAMGTTSMLQRDAPMVTEDGDAAANFALMQREAARKQSVTANRLRQHTKAFQNNEQNAMQKNAQKTKNITTRLLAFKGAPEVVLKRCSFILINGSRVPLDDGWKKKFANTIETLARGGERILGFAQLEFEDDKDPSSYNVDLRNFPENDLCFVGLISLMDPPRPSVPRSVASCHSAGIKVAMVTGDHPLTAQAIAKQIGLLTLPTREEMAEERGVDVDQIPEEEVKTLVVSGMELRDWTDEDWAKHINKKQFVFARTSPQQKLIIVSHFQGNGEVVGVTGDGVNDSPALKQANIGIAMGIAGSEVAKEAADVILMDDNFTSIISGVEEGRVIFENLSKSIMYTLSHLLPEVLPFILNMAFGLPAALSAQLILIIDLGTELAPAISLAYEGPESNIMNSQPRNIHTDKLVSIKNLLYAYVQLGIIESACGFASFFYVFSCYGFGIKDMFSRVHFGDNAEPFAFQGKVYTADDQLEILKMAQTAYFVGLVFSQLANLVACKTRYLSVFQHGFRNRTMNFAFGIVLAIVAIVVFAPFAHVALETRIPPLTSFLIPLPFMFFIVAHTEVLKLLKRRQMAKERQDKIARGEIFA